MQAQNEDEKGTKMTELDAQLTGGYTIIQRCSIIIE